MLEMKTAGRQDGCPPPWPSHTSLNIKLKKEDGRRDRWKCCSLPVRGGQSVQMPHCSSLWLKGQKSISKGRTVTWMLNRKHQNIPIKISMSGFLLIFSGKCYFSRLDLLTVCFLKLIHSHLIWALILKPFCCDVLFLFFHFGAVLTCF